MLCVIAKLDNEAAEKLAFIRKEAVPEEMAAPFHGHITIVTYIGNDEAQFIRICKTLLEGTRRFEVMYESIKILEETSVIVAVPEKSPIFDSMHQNIAERFSEDLDKWTQADTWYPHTTLFCGPEPDLGRICRKMADVFKPFTAGISAIEFSRVLENGYGIIDQMELTPQ